MTTLRRLLVYVFGVVFVSIVGAEIYRWVDDEGNVHYGDCPPADCEPEMIKPAPMPTEQEVEEAQERLKRLQDEVEKMREDRVGDAQPAEAQPAEKTAVAAAMDPECFAPLAEGWSGRIADTREQVSRQPLTDGELRQLTELFRGLSGLWKGVMEDITCLRPDAEPPTQSHRYRFRLNARRQPDQIFRIEADADGIETKQVFRQFFWFLLNRDGLRFRTTQSDISFEIDQRGNDAEVLSAGNNVLTFFWRRAGAVRRANVFSLQKVGRGFTIREFFYVQGTLAGKRIWSIEK